MHSRTDTKESRQAILSQSYEGMEDAIDRGSAAACISGLAHAANVSAKDVVAIRSHASLEVATYRRDA
jgi:hypothetical protein